MIEKIENILIGISRYFLIFLGAFALIVSIFVLIYSLALISDKPNFSPDTIKSTSYEKYADSLFPKNIIKNQKQTTLKSASPNQTTDTTDASSSPVNQVFINLRDSMSYQFNDSQEMINLFKQNITPRSLQNYIDTRYLVSLSIKQQNDSLNALVKLFNDLEDVNDFKRIGSFDSRLDLVSKLIELFFDDIYNSIENNKLKRSKSIQDSIANNAKGYSYLMYVLYALAIYAAAVLYLMIFKVEIDLRRIPPAIKNEDN